MLSQNDSSRNQTEIIGDRSLQVTHPLNLIRKRFFGPMRPLTLLFFCGILLSLSKADGQERALGQPSWLDCPSSHDPIQTFYELEGHLNQAKNPFSLACRDQLLNVAFPMPMDSRYTRNKLDERAAKQFLGAVIARAELYLEANRGINGRILGCLNDRTQDRCAQVLDFVLEKARKAAREAREEMAIVHEIDGSLGRFGFATSHAVPLTPKPVQWARYSADEITNARRYVSEMKKRLETLTRPGTSHFEKATELIKFARTEQKTETARRLFRLSLETLREEHFEAYESKFGDFIPLAFLSSPSPSLAEVEAAIKIVEQNRIREAAMIADLKKDLTRNGGVSGNVMSALLKYRPLLEEVLRQDPKYCNLAVRWLSVHHNRERNLTAGIMMPLLASGFIFPPAGGAIAGLALDVTASSYFVGQAWYEFKSTTQSRHIGLSDNEALISNSDFFDAHARYVLEATMAPTAAIGAPVRAIRSRLKSIRGPRLPRSGDVKTDAP